MIKLEIKESHFDEAPGAEHIHQLNTFSAGEVEGLYSLDLLNYLSMDVLADILFQVHPSNSVVLFGLLIRILSAAQKRAGTGRKTIENRLLIFAQLNLISVLKFEVHQLLLLLQINK